jgi:hypothetical protein
MTLNRMYHWVFEMPPEPAWFAGRPAVGAFLGAHVLIGPGRFAATALFAPKPCRC